MGNQRGYSTPTFPMTAAIVSAGVLDSTQARLTALCNLALGKGVTTQGWSFLEGADAIFTRALFPRGTDVRDRFSTGGPDAIECPSGSGRWYLVHTVLDVGSGFPNEYRLAIIYKTGSWPTPLPPIWSPPAGAFADGMPLFELGGEG